MVDKKQDDQPETEPPRKVNVERKGPLVNPEPGRAPTYSDPQGGRPPAEPYEPPRQVK